MGGILSAEHFFGIDTLIDTLIVVVAVLIAIQSKKIYSLINNKNYKLFFIAFLSIATAFIFKIFWNLTILHTFNITKVNLLEEIMTHLEYLMLINFFAVLLYKIFLILGFMTLFLIINKNKKTPNMMLFIYLGIVSVILSIYFQFIFYLTITIINVMLMIHFYENYKKVGTKNSYLVFLAFLLVLISNMIGIFYSFSPLVYLIQELFLFGGFLVLLINHMKLGNGKEKN